MKTLFFAALPIDPSASLSFLFWALIFSWQPFRRFPFLSILFSRFGFPVRGLVQSFFTSAVHLFRGKSLLHRDPADPVTGPSPPTLVFFRVLFRHRPPHLLIVFFNFSPSPTTSLGSSRLFLIRDAGSFLTFFSRLLKVFSPLIFFRR